MKKEYIAPDLYFESYTLSQSVAGGCNSVGIDVVITEREGKTGAFTASTPSNQYGYTCTYFDAEMAAYWGSNGANLFLS